MGVGASGGGSEAVSARSTVAFTSAMSNGLLT